MTPFSESFQAIIWHCLVSDPRLQTKNQMVKNKILEKLKIKIFADGADIEGIKLLDKKISSKASQLIPP